MVIVAFAAAEAANLPAGPVIVDKNNLDGNKTGMFCNFSL